MRGKRAVKEYDFPELVGVVDTLSDFYEPNTSNFLSHDQFCNKYMCNISQEKYIDVRYIIGTTIQKLGIDKNKLVPEQRPFKPFLIHIILASSKGCRTYTQLLQNKLFLKSNVCKRETKWHEELGSVLSLDFWKKARKLNSDMHFDNNLKWLQYRILRNCLQTNFIVSHFRNDVNRLCSYCLHEDELISHLFWSCNVIKNFLQ